MVAPHLIATVRHCVAKNTPGAFSCTASGDLIANDTGAGTIGFDDLPSSLTFFTSASVTQGVQPNNPDAVGVRIVSTNTSTACRDDLAFVVLDRVIPGVVPLPLRLDPLTLVGEPLSVWGYGLTDHIEGTALRVRTDVPVVAVGPDKPSTTPQPAPVRTIKTGSVTCLGDSGGPFVGADGTVVAVVSVGAQTDQPYCDDDAANLGTVGPRIGAYKPLATLALGIADPPSDAGADTDPDASSDEGDDRPDADGSATTADDVSIPDVGGEVGQPPEVGSGDDSGCEIHGFGSSGCRQYGWMAVAGAVAAIAKGRRRRNGSQS